MTSLPLLRIAARSVRRNARHSLGSILAIAVGFVAIAFFDGYLSHIGGEHTGRILERFMIGHVLVERTRFSDLVLSGTGEKLPVLGREEQVFLDAFLEERRAEVEARVRFQYAWGLASAGKASTQFVAYGYDVEDAARMRRRYAWDALAGRPLQRAGKEDAVLLSRGLGSLLGCELDPARPVMTEDGLPIAEERPFTCAHPRVQLVASTASGQLNAIEPEVVGLQDGGLREHDVKMLAMPLPLVQRLVDSDELSYYSVLLRDASRAGAFARELNEAARAKGVDVVARRFEEHHSAEEQRRGMALLGAFRGLAGVVVVIIAAMSILTTMAKSVSERTREIGTLRSLGFLRRHVVALFAIEAGLLALVASAVGLVATIALTALVNGAGITYDAGVMAQPFPLRVSYVPGTYANAALFLAVVAALAATVPARRAARARIPDALTHV